MAVILGLSLTLWSISLALFDIGHVPRSVSAIPLAGMALCAVYHFLVIRCPYCRRRLGHLMLPLTNFSLLRFPKRVRFCPHCTIDFQNELPARK
jgi:hypothetical protein